MHVGILGGTGPAGRGLAVRLSAAGVAVTVGSRDAAAGRRGGRRGARALAGASGSAVDSGRDNAGAAAADLVVVATPWDGAVATVRPLADALAARWSSPWPTRW